MYRLISCENLGGDIYLIARDEDGDKFQIKVEDFRPYLYVKDGAEIPDDEDIREHIDEIEEGDWTSVTGYPLKRIYTYEPSDVPKVRDEFDRAWEADVPYSRRFLIDRGIKDFFTIEQGSVQTGDEDGCGFIRTRYDFVHPADYDETEWDVKNKYMYLDIETIDLDILEPTLISMTVLYEGKFYSFGVKYVGDEGSFSQDYYEREKFDKPWDIHIFDSTSEMLKKFTVFMRHKFPDGIVGWNLDSFDIPSILNSLENNGINPGTLSVFGKSVWKNDRIPGIVPFDLMKLFTMSQATGQKYDALKDIAERCDFKIPKHIRKDIPDLWRDGDLMDIIDYNAYDVEALPIVDDKFKLIEDQLQSMRDVGAREMDIYRKTSMHDLYILHERREKDEILPWFDNKKDDTRLKGGKVFEPSPGIYEYILTLDLSKIYPEIIRSCNLSYETYVPSQTDKSVKMPSGYSFEQTEGALLPRVVDKLFKRDAELKENIRDAGTEEERELWKNKRASFKRLRNSLFGVTVKPFFRLYRPAIAKTITKIGRDILTVSKECAEGEGFTVIGGDTDSIFVNVYATCTEDAVDMGTVLAEKINESIDRYSKEVLDIEEHNFIMEFESVAETMLQTDRKKRYAKKVVWEDGEYLDNSHKDVKGFEYKRSDEPDVSKDMQDKLFDMILEGESKEKQINHIRLYYDDVKDRLHDPHYIAKTPRIKKHPDEYKNYPPHVRAIVENALDCDFRVGDRIYWVYMDDGFHVNVDESYVGRESGQQRINDMEETRVSSHVMGFKASTEIPDNIERHIDYQRMAVKTVMDKVKTIFRALGYDNYRKEVRGQKFT